MKRGIVKMIKYVLLYNCLFVVFNYLFYGYATVYDELKWLLATAVLASPFGYHLWYLTAYLQVLIYNQPDYMLAAFPALFNQNGWWIAYTVVGIAGPLITLEVFNKIKGIKINEYKF